MTVWYEDGTDTEVVCDQRDFAAFELAHKIGMPTALDACPMVFFRFIAWHGLKRTEVIDPKTSQAAWDKTVVEVEAVDEDEDEDGPQVPLDSSESGPPEVPGET